MSVCGKGKDFVGLVFGAAPGVSLNEAVAFEFFDGPARDVRVAVEGSGGKVFKGDGRLWNGRRRY